MPAKISIPSEFRNLDAEGWTKMALADHFGVSRMTIARWRQKTRPIPPGPNYRRHGRTHNPDGW